MRFHYEDGIVKRDDRVGGMMNEADPGNTAGVNPGEVPGLQRRHAEGSTAVQDAGMSAVAVQDERNAGKAATGKRTDQHI